MHAGVYIARISTRVRKSFREAKRFGERIDEAALTDVLPQPVTIARLLVLIGVDGVAKGTILMF